MTTAVLEQVRPAGSRIEALALAIVTVGIAALLVLWVRSHGRAEDHPQLYEWQISAFETLSGADQTIYNALFTAKDEIVYIFDDINMMNAPGQKFRWPALQDLQDALLPPFYQDRSWEQTGSLQWRLHEPLGEGEMQGSVMYLGTDGRAPGQGSFLLVIGHVHAGFRNNNAIMIWWNPRNHVEMPQSGFRDGLILQGWREVVPHSGAAEVERIFGEDVPGGDAATADEIVEDLFGAGQ
jgi:hypothetical protein